MTIEWDALADLPDDAPADHFASISLCEALDRVLHKGVALRGEIVLSVADVDLVYLGLQVVLCSTETAARAGILPPRLTPAALPAIRDVL
jgi:gas vesicle structural protein